LITKVHIPSHPLNRFIDSFFYYSGFNPEHRVDRFLPDGEVQLIFDLTDEPQYVYDNETLKEIQQCRYAWFSGFRTGPISIPSGKESEMIIVQFKKGKAYSFLTEPMYNLTNVVADAELVIKADILNIRERLLEAKTPSQKLHLLEKHFLGNFLNQLHENALIDFAVSRIAASPDQCSIREISEKAGYSQKHLIHSFKKYVGVTPKEFLKVMRFQQAIRQIESQVEVNWPAIAYECGYYDQCHFIADFRQFSGFTPSEYVRQRGEYPNYVPVE
jgi:AraC-like DNA-binding protein